MAEYLVRCEVTAYAYEAPARTIAVSAPDAARARALALEAYGDPLAQATIVSRTDGADHPSRLLMRQVLSDTLAAIATTAAEAAQAGDRALHADLSALHTQIAAAAHGRL